MTTATARQVSTHGELVAAVDGDPFVRWEIPADLPRPAWVLGRSAAILRDTHSGLPGLAAVGDGDEIRQLLTTLAGQQQIAGVRTMTLPRSAVAAIERAGLVGPTGGEWDWMWTSTEPPAQPAEDRLVALDDDADADELTALNAIGNPTAESDPGTGRTELWLGVRSSAGAIIAAGALHRNAAGTGHLTGIVTDPAHRGDGLGAAVSAGLTRAAQRLPGPGTGVSTLGVYAGNGGAARIYRRLGYRAAQQFASRRIAG